MLYETFRNKHRIVKRQYDERPNYFVYIVQTKKFLFFWKPSKRTWTTKRILSSQSCVGECKYVNFPTIERAEDAIKEEYLYVLRLKDEVVA
jgi:hypothetical protein